jgi:hypothetical protein
VDHEDVNAEVSIDIDNLKFRKGEKPKITKEQYLAALEEKEHQKLIARNEAVLAQFNKADDDNEQDANDNVQWHKYTYDPYFRMDIERDEDKPDPTIFFEVGYDPREKGTALD